MAETFSSMGTCGNLEPIFGQVLGRTACNKAEESRPATVNKQQRFSDHNVGIETHATGEVVTTYSFLGEALRPHLPRVDSPR
jgi:hypothetical protein